MVLPEIFIPNSFFERLAGQRSFLSEFVGRPRTGQAGINGTVWRLDPRLHYPE